MKKVRLLCLLVLCFFLVGCGIEKEEESTSGTRIYYLNSDGNRIESITYRTKGVTTQEIVEEYLACFWTLPKDSDYQLAMPDNVKLASYEIQGNQLALYFNESYESMDVTREVLARAALVRTMIQVKDIDCISFYVNDKPLRDAKGEYVGLMTEDSFVENVGQQINAIVEQQFTLYYPSFDGKSLVPIEKKVHTSSNISSEKMVIEHLFEADPKGAYQSPIPEGTKLISVSTVDGVCFVNFDDGFLMQNYAIEEPIVIYSIVDSLCELSSVNRVQISVNGKTDVVYRETYSLDELYERNLDFLQKKKTEEP
ncbi:MAG: GerMN domain-containing protein [Lachnospiraceae bacterium]